MVIVALFQRAGPQRGFDRVTQYQTSSNKKRWTIYQLQMVIVALFQRAGPQRSEPPGAGYVDRGRHQWRGEAEQGAAAHLWRDCQGFDI